MRPRLAPLALTVRVDIELAGQVVVGPADRATVIGVLIEAAPLDRDTTRATVITEIGCDVGLRAPSNWLVDRVRVVCAVTRSGKREDDPYKTVIV